MTRRTIDELGDLLELPYCAVLSTHRADGTVLLSPVWHEWRDGGFNISVPAGDIKLRHLVTAPRASVVVFDHHWPARGIEVCGIAQVSTEPDHALDRRLTVRYLGPTNGSTYAETAGSGLVLRVEPGTLRAWDYADVIGPDPEIATFPIGSIG